MNELGCQFSFVWIFERLKFNFSKHCAETYLDDWKIHHEVNTFASLQWRSIFRNQLFLILIFIFFIYRLLFGTLYPAYRSYKAIKNKDVREYVSISFNVFVLFWWIIFLSIIRNSLFRYCSFSIHLFFASHLGGKNLKTLWNINIPSVKHSHTFLIWAYQVCIESLSKFLLKFLWLYLSSNLDPWFRKYMHLTSVNYNVTIVITLFEII